MKKSVLDSIPAKVTVDLEVVNRAVPGAFVRVFLTSVTLLTGTHEGRGFLSGFKMQNVSHIFCCVFQIRHFL